MKTHVIGFPRIGEKRELKKALEQYWKHEITKEELNAVARNLKHRHWEIQFQAGLDYVTTGDFSYYDQILDITYSLNLIPERFKDQFDDNLELYFAMARGNAKQNIPALEMTKWFNTNYHYLVPEISATMKPSLTSNKVLAETKEAILLGYKSKPTIVGPVTYLSLSKGVDGFNVWDKYQEITKSYKELLSELDGLCDWIQIEEPILSGNLPQKARKCFNEIYQNLNSSLVSSKILLTTYFDACDEHLDLAFSSGCGGLHIDAVSDCQNIDYITKHLPKDMVLSIGIVDGKNVWKNHIKNSLLMLSHIKPNITSDRLLLSTSCSLLHVPFTVNNEMKLDPEIRSWLSFAVQKCEELTIIKDIYTGKNRLKEINENEISFRAKKSSDKVHNEQIKSRIQQINSDMLNRRHPFQVRKQAQSWLNIPILPTTTIGSFPQTSDIRQKRQAFKRGAISEQAYNDFLQQEIKNIIRIQEELGLDVLVHGEPERNDMVEYFAQFFSGVCFTKYGWVQSYGSRCVKPPIIYGDVSRLKPMTIDWIKCAQSFTDKPVKGMLTGPVTILCWSFIRNDIKRLEVCQQIALAIRDEVQELEGAGVKIIQVDEAAFSEGMPMKLKDRKAYFNWAVNAFRLATSGVDDSTQIHTHMCYSEFNSIIDHIATLDVDVISIESSRSNMELLNTFSQYHYPNEIGPGVYDIHSPRVPSKNEILNHLKNAAKHLPIEKLWVNPDCGLKTRNWKEVKASLENMVSAAKEYKQMFLSD